MTKTNMSLTELLEKHDEGDFLRAVAEAVLQLIMETDVEGVIGAGRHERAGARTTYRNGYRDRSLDTRLGTPKLRVPKLRQGSYFPGFLEPRRTSDKALVAVIQGEPASRHRFETAGERDRRGVDPTGGRTGAGNGALGHLQEHRVEALQGYRRAGRRVSEPAACGRLAVPLARCHLPEGASGRADRQHRVHNSRGREHRRAARDRRPGDRPLGSGDLLDGVPARPQGAASPARSDAASRTCGSKLS